VTTGRRRDRDPNPKTPSRFCSASRQSPVAMARQRGKEADMDMDVAASRTAMWVTVERGQHRLLDAPPWVFDDTFALVLLGPAWRDVSGFLRARIPDHLLVRVRADLLVRARFAEDRLNDGRLHPVRHLGCWSRHVRLETSRSPSCSSSRPRRSRSEPHRACRRGAARLTSQRAGLRSQRPKSA
jgi:hypothetical protein